jgi:hypothetical protein
MVTGIAPTIAHAWIDRQLAFWSPAWVLGGCALAAAVALVVRAPLVRWAQLPSWASVAYVVFLGVALAWTLSPRSAGDHYFDFDAVRPRCIAWRRDIVTALSTPEWQFNLGLLAPIGAATALARRAPARRRLLLLAAVPPIIVEGAQLAVRSLNRVCEGSDIVTNWLGLLAGYAVVRTAVRVSRRGPHDEEPGAGGPTVSNGQRSTSSPSTASTVTVSPSATLPSRICIASVSASSRWMTRLSGRAPNAGS